MVTRNDERVTCHLSGLDQRDRRASAEGILGDIKPRNGGNEFGILCDPLDSMELHWNG